MDDHGVALPGARPTSKANAPKEFGFVTLLHQRLGLVLHPLKGERDGTQQLTPLGFTVETAGNQVRPSNARLARLHGTTACGLESASSNRRWVRRKPLESVAGSSVSATLAIPEARWFTRDILDDLVRPAEGE